jgi:hypothetical protein
VTRRRAFVRRWCVLIEHAHNGRLARVASRHFTRKGAARAAMDWNAWDCRERRQIARWLDRPEPQRWRAVVERTCRLEGAS